ncbi:MAG: glycosyltransferase family 39 protein [Thermoguttaceae bacterium]|jgi:4-amino-4-deoxy-L-arabinose transferase-like glycosyltransferase
MRKLWEDQLWIGAAAAIIFFTNLGACRLWDMDEPLYASCARTMLDSHDWVVPTYNGHVFYDKPPLMFWTMLGGFEMFGVSEFAARFWSAVFGIATALATYHLGRLLFRREIGLWAGLIVASTIIFTVSARAATVDSALTFVTTLAVLLFVIGTRCRADDRDERRPYSLPLLAMSYACLGAAILAKGPIGALLPLATLALFMLIVSRSWGIGSLAALAWKMRPMTAIAAVLLVTLPWYVLVDLRTHGEWLRRFVGQHNVQPFLEPSYGHSGPFYYHLVVIFIGFFPWSVFLGRTLLHVVRRLRTGHAWQRGYVLMTCWVAVFFLFWSVCSTKLPHYVLPAYPALALLTAAFLYQWLEEPGQVHRWWLRLALGTVVLVGVGMTAAMPLVAAKYIPGEEILAVLGLILVIGAGAGLLLLERDHRYATLTLFAIASVLFVTGIFAWAAVRVDRHQHTAPLVAEVRRASPGAAQIAGYRFEQASLVFYAGEDVPWLNDAAQLRRFLGAAGQPYIFTTGEFEAEIQRQFPDQLQVLARRPRFLGRGEVLVLGPKRPSYAGLFR